MAYPAYATVEQVQDYLDGTLPDNLRTVMADVTQGEVDVAINDINRQGSFTMPFRGPRYNYLGRDQETGLKINVDNLAIWQKQALVEAVAWQVKMRRLRGDLQMSMPQYQSVSGQSSSTTGVLPSVSPDTIERLVDAGMWNAGGDIGSSRNRGVRPIAVERVPIFGIYSGRRSKGYY